MPGNTGITGVNVIPFGPGGNLCTFELVARGDVGDQGFANGQVLGATEGVTDGQLTIVEVDGTIAIVGQEYVFTAQGTPAWGDQGWYSQAIPRTLGKALKCQLSKNTTATHLPLIGWHNAQTCITGSIDGVAYYFPNSTNLSKCDGAGAVRIIGTYAAAADYQLAVVLGGYDINGVPWDDGQPAANFLYGNALYIKGGIYTDWTLVWREVTDNTATLYTNLSLYNCAGNIDDWIAPVYDYSEEVLQPTVKDTFTDVPNTSLDVHTPDVAPVGSPWIEGRGDWRTTGTQAQLVATLNRSFCIIESGSPDGFIRTTCNSWAPTLAVANDSGISFRNAGAANRWWLGINDLANAFRLIERNGAVNNTRATVGVAIVGGQMYEVSAALNGTLIQGWLDGGSWLSFVSAFNQTEERHGMQLVRDTEVQDNFHISPLADYDALDTCP